MLTSLSASAQQVIHVDASQTQNPPDGLSWQSAFRSLDAALAAAVSNDQVWVRHGVYQPSLTGAPDATDPRTRAFRIPSGVELYGGFAGNELQLDERPGDLYEQTVLNGDYLRTPGQRGDDAYSVVVCLPGANLTVIDGFKIEYGNSDYLAPEADMRRRGGGIYCSGSSLHLENLTLTQNLAIRGGGLYLSGELEPSAPGETDPQIATVAVSIKACNFVANYAEERGGGAHLAYFVTSVGDQIEQSYVFNSRFTFNRAGTNTWDDRFGGAGLFVDASDAVLKVGNTLFSENSVIGYGGGVLLMNGNQVHFGNCTIANNRSLATEAEVGGVEDPGGAGLYVHTGNGNSYLYNSIVWGNTGAVMPSDVTGPGAAIEGGDFSVRYSNLNYSLVAGQTVHPGPGNINADPLFVSAAGQNYELQSGSPCLDAGHDPLILADWADLDEDGITSGEQTPLDILLRDRTVDIPGVGTSSFVDMGAYERPAEP